MACPADDVAVFASKGPVYSSIPQSVPPERWLHLGRLLAAKLTSNPAASLDLQSLDPRVAIRIYHLYLPVYFWMHSFVCERRADDKRQKQAVVIGLSAPQGCGKTTLVTNLIDLFSSDRITSAAVSIDDFYLRGEDQDRVAQSSPGNALLQVRGNAGTHDVELGVATLQALCSAQPGEVRVPRYDKAARNGKGDRAPENEWLGVQTPCDVVLVEGWMLGFKPIADDADDGLLGIHQDLPVINANLKEYQVWDDLVDGWCILALADKSQVFHWRLQAEHEMIASGKKGMDDVTVADFVGRYMPAYEAYCPDLYASACAGGIDGRPTLGLHMNALRSPVAQP